LHGLLESEFVVFLRAIVRHVPKMTWCPLMTTHLVEGRCHYLQVSLPLVRFCHQNVVPEILENRISLQRLEEPLTGAEYRL